MIQTSVFFILFDDYDEDINLSNFLDLNYNDTKCDKRKTIICCNGPKQEHVETKFNVWFVLNTILIVLM